MGALLAVTMLFGGCATHQASVDYTAFRQAKPRSLLVLPPVNNSPDVNATNSMLAQATRPLAESGYYVIPVTLMNETFRQNGLSNPTDIHAVAPAKLNEIFGADAALYITIQQYGTTYSVLNSVATVSADAKLLDLRTGTTLWTGSASANNNQNNNSGGGLAGLLVAAIVKQVLNNTTDASHLVAGQASNVLLSAGRPNGLLYGPRSPKFGTDGLAQP
ncbi:MAG: DUF799 domain-containing protein [Aquabacterium sp.]